jgi:lipoprotein-anchoring transpeptidase ErfK/SrfK
MLALLAVQAAAASACTIERKSGDAPPPSGADSAAASDPNDISFPVDTAAINDVLASVELRGDTSWRAAADAHLRQQQPDLAASAAHVPLAAVDTGALATLSPERVNARAVGPALGSQGPAVLRAQVLLDRAGFSPGAIDGAWGANTGKAVYWYQAASRLPVSGAVDSATLAHLERAVGGRPAVIRYAVTAEDVAGPFVPLGKTPYEQAKQECLCYESAWEMLAERFHTTRELLGRLNPGVDTTQLAAGAEVWVPNVERPSVVPLVSAPAQARLANLVLPDTTGRTMAAPAGAGATQAQAPAAPRRGAPRGAPPADTAAAAVPPAAATPTVARIVVSKRGGYLHAVDSSGRVLLHAPNTLGSSYNPSPEDGAYTVTRVVAYPTFHYNPKLYAEVPDDRPDARLPAGPNSPVGAVWMALSKPHFGIHGTSAPSTIGYASSHGCVRLTNWDARWLAEHTPAGTQVEFVQ